MKQEFRRKKSSRLLVKRVRLELQRNSSDALNEVDAELNSENPFRARGNRRTKPSLRVIGRKTAGIGGGDSGGCRGRGVGRGLPRYRRPG